MKTANFSRADYLNDRCTHAEYYAQFVTDHIKERVRHYIGEKTIRASRDPHFNDIPLAHWDRMQALATFPVAAMREAGDYMTLSGIVCIAKEAARQIKEGK